MAPRSCLLIAFGLTAVATVIPSRQPAAQSPTAAPVVEKASLDSPRILSLHEGKFSIDLSRYPVSGSVSAKNVVVIISDFTCPHSRETEKAFIDALDGFKPGDVALVHLPGTREKKDGPTIHKIMLSLWQEHPAIYRRLSAQMIYEELLAEPGKVRAAAAAALGGPMVLDALLKKHSTEADGQMELTSRLMIANAESLARVALPQIMVGQKLVTGSILNPAELQNYIQEQFAVAPVHLVFAPRQIPPNNEDPCEPTKRSTCGRLVISIIGAGEWSTTPVASMNDTVPHDKHGAEGASHLLQFTANSNSKLPSKHIVLTSDPDIKKGLSKLPFSAKVSLAGIVDASLPAYERMVSPGSADSPLNRALASFAATSGCRKLTSGTRSVVPFLKVDIIFDSEFAGSNELAGYYGIPVFKRAGTVGTFERWIKEGTVLGKVELAGLMQRLEGSLVHVFAKSCKAGIIANLFDTAMDGTATCGCFLAVSDEVQDTNSGGGISAPFNFAMADSGQIYSRVKNSEAFARWPGFGNLALMAPLLLDRNETIIMNPGASLGEDDPDIDRDLSLEKHRNPLFGFVYTSVDSTTNKILALLRDSSKTSDQAKAIAEAEFTDEITKLVIPQYKEGSSPGKFDADIARIRERLAFERKELGPMVDHDSRSKLDATVYIKQTDAFTGCLGNNGSAPESHPEFCSTFKEMVNTFNEKIRSKAPPSPDESLLIESYRPFIAKLKEIHFARMWPRYIAGDFDREWFRAMWDAKYEYLKFKKGVEPLYVRGSVDRLSADERESLEKRRRVFTYINDSFEAAYESARSQVFDQLKKESTTTKLMRTEAAVDLLAANIDSIKPAGEGEKLIARLASKLNCLTRYKVGPAHDQQPPGPIIPY